MFHLVNYRISRRGYDYYKNGKVIDCMCESDNQYKGLVEGSYNNFYKVSIDLKNPYNSRCDCPYAKDNKNICKHMIALLFTASEEAVFEYETENFNEYDEEYEEEYDEYLRYYNNYSDRENIRDKFIEPIFYDELLNDFIEDLTEDDAKKILQEEFSIKKEYFFNKYLKEKFQENCCDYNNIQGVIDKINKRFNNLVNNYDYNNKSYTDILLLNKEKEKISSNYRKMKKYIDYLILNPELSIYNEYRWIASFYKKNNPPKEVIEYSNKIEEYFKEFKKNIVKNTLPKSNILITIFILNDFTLSEIASSMIKNAKYMEYIDYILTNIENTKELYDIFDKQVDETKFLNKEKIADVYYKFYNKLKLDEVYAKYLYYEFLYSKNSLLLEEFRKKINNYNEYFDKLMDKQKDITILQKMYIFLDKKKELFELLCNKKNEYNLINNIEFLKKDYSVELEKYFKNRFYEVLIVEKSRENYKRAAIYITALYRLDDGKKIVNDFVLELRESTYSNRRALFDEINKVILYEENKEKKNKILS